MDNDYIGNEDVMNTKRYEQAKRKLRNETIMAQTLGQIYELTIQRYPGNRAQQILDKAKLNQLILHLLSAPEEFLPIC